MSPTSRPGSVFISYKREEAAAATHLREALVKEGFNVWWDEDLQCGQAWAEKLDEAVRDAACIVVLWSELAVASQWIRHEASQAIAREVYAPCRIELVQLDSPYDRMQATDLIGWEGDREHGGFRNLMARVDTLVPASVSLPRRIGRWLLANLATLVASGIAAFAVWLLVTIYIAQQADRQEKVYDCSASVELRTQLARAMYSKGERLDGVCLHRANLQGVDLTGAKLYEANLSGANLALGNLTGANLSGANLTAANLHAANLSGANLIKVDLTTALLMQADLTGANLRGANLSGANLAEANLTGANLIQVCADKSPEGWPQNLPPPQLLPCRRGQSRR